MNSDASRQELEKSLMELRRDVLYPKAPNVAGQVRARIAAETGRSSRHVIGLPAMYAVAAVMIFALVLFLSPGARATLIPWWAADSSCPGPIPGAPLHMKTVSATELCRRGIVLTRPDRRAFVSRLKAIAIAEGPSGLWRAREVVLGSVHNQRMSPTSARLTWVVSAVSSAEVPVKPSRVWRTVGFVFFVDARTGRIFAQVRTVTLGPPRQLGIPRLTYSSIVFPNRKDGFILATNARGTQYLLSTVDDGMSWVRRSLPWNSRWFHFVNALDGWAIGSPACGCNHPVTALFRTRNGGRTWQRLTTLKGSAKAQFASRYRGWLQVQQSSGSTILQTKDGGDKWQPTKWPFRTDEWSFGNANNGWARVQMKQRSRSVGCAPSQLYVTFNSGRTWFKRPASPGCYTLPSFGNLDDGWMLVDPNQYQMFQPPPNCTNHNGCPEALLQTVNGGRSWTTEHPVAQDQPPSTGIVGLNALWPGGASAGLEPPIFVDAFHGWMVADNPTGGVPLPRGMSGGVTTTADGGATWRLHHLGGGAFEIAATSRHEAWVTVFNAWVQPNQSYVLHTTDDGRHWRLVQFGV
jgi:photosystem II stability/assembly factor-like uncharacterized protein